MKPLTSSMLFSFGLGLTGCGTVFGIGPAEDAGADTFTPNDAGVSDVASSDGSASDASPGDRSPGDGSPRDVSLDADAQGDATGDERRDAVASDVVRDAPRSDSSGSDVDLGDGAQADIARSDAAPADAPLDESTSDVSGGDGPCVAETDRQFCARLGKTCEMVSGTDSCAMPRNVNCGTCAGGMGCVDGVCRTPVCSGFNYSSSVFQPFSVAGAADFVIATSGAGESILYAQSPVGDCSTASTYLADEITPGSRTYTSRPITAWIDSHAATGQALSGDGLTLFTLSRDSKSYRSARRSALHLLDFGTPSAADFTEVNAMLTGTVGSFSGGVISADGMEFYYGISGTGTASDGLYSSKRLAPGSPFAAGARLTGIDPSFTAVTGVSSDRLTLFVFRAWAGFVLTRTSTSAEFSNPNAPNPPPELVGFQHKPLADCATLVGTHAIGGGCTNQDVIFLTRQ